MLDLVLRHYREEGSLLVPRDTSALQDDERHKPTGLWVTVDGEDDWRTWCIGESFSLGRLAERWTLRLRSDARILWATCCSDILALGQKYQKPNDGEAWRWGLCWSSLAQDYQGLLIIPYQWSLRLSEQANWYYSWDCSSGCIWDPAAIESVVRDEDYVFRIDEREMVE